MRILIIIAVAFGLGYATHLLQTNGFSPTNLITPVSSKPSNENPDVFITTVDYNGGKFNPNAVSVRKGNYLVIRNKSDSLMWLASTYSKLNTPRGYGESEELRIKPEEIGSYKVSNKLNLDASMIVNVIP